MSCLTGTITSQQSLSVNEIRCSSKLLGDIQSPKLLYAHIDAYRHIYAHIYTDSCISGNLQYEHISGNVGCQKVLTGRCNLCCCIADFVSWFKDYVTIENQFGAVQENNLTSVFAWSIDTDSDNIEIIPKQGNGGIDMPVTIRVNKINDSIDKTINVTAISKDRTASFVVIQPGLRERFVTADEQSLITFNEEIFGVLK